LTLEVDFQDEEGYVFVEVKGDSDMGGMLEAFEKIIVYSTVNQAKKMLVDCRGIESQLPLAEIASISEKFNNIQGDYEGLMGFDVTFAFLIDEKVHDLTQINQTLYEGKEQPTYLGSDIVEAEKWLLTK
jgi:hypothetical protein